MTLTKHLKALIMLFLSLMIGYPSLLLAQTQTFNYSGAIQTWTVPAGVNNVTIEAQGGQGGSGGGLGAIIKGDFTVTPGETISLIVGGQGAGFNGSNTSGPGGGGGSFVWSGSFPGANLLVAAGGGGGKNKRQFPSDRDATTGLDGKSASSNGGAGGTNGNGGTQGWPGGSNPASSGAGCGWLTDGGGPTGVQGGKSPENGGAGGTHTVSGAGNGGFGGGGAGGFGAGGGGGYSGGGGGGWSNPGHDGAGGGSFNGGSNQNNSIGRSGNGLVTITYAAPCPDNDGDGHTDAACGGDDCNDNDVNVNPSATEICGDGIDNNCNGQVDEGCIAAEALDLDGTDDFVGLGTTLGNFGTDDFTVEFMINTTSPGGFNNLLSKRPICNYSNFWSVSLWGGKVYAELCLNSSSSTLRQISYATPINDGSWHHVAIVREGTSFKLYVDGILRASTTTAGVYSFSNAAPLEIGGGPCGFIGFKVDEVRIWNKAVPAIDISGYMGCEFTGNECDLTAYYQFNEGFASQNNSGITTLPDITGNGYDGQLNNLALNGSTSNWVQPGAVVTGSACGAPQGCCSDNDGDGYDDAACGGNDCDDNDASVHPNATEICDGIDNDCDGNIDEGFDVDNDGYTSCGGDCDDNDASVHPNATEICDGIDNDCDGGTDEGFDVDNDGYTSCGGDCDDNDANINPAATEICDGIDNDCDGGTDEGFDVDNDGYTSCGGDCDDNDANINPAATEICDGIDNDCDGNIDEGFDVDGDGYTSCGGDCDDNDASINPGATEVCDGIDNDCDGLIDTADPNFVDNTDPDITCPANVTKECDQSTSSIWTGTATATDNCTASPTITESDVSTQGSSGCSYYSYTITRTWTADDGNGNTASCDQTITVDDSTGPSITCPANVTIECDESSLPANTGTATAVDNCDTQPAITSSDATAPGNCANGWSITRTWTATDACGNASSCDQVITVDDSTGPDITCPANVTVECDADNTSAATGTATTVDNCDAAPTVSESDATAAGNCANEWTITRTWTATDACGNTSSCDQVITVDDSTGPDITCPANVTVECDADNTSTATGTATAMDNCDAAPSISESDATTPGSCANGWTITRTWTATDACGNASSCDQTIDVVDSTAPDMACGPLTITLNTDGTYALSQTEIDGLGAGSTDNCGAVVFSASPNTFECANEGANTVTVTGTDDCGNAATCSATVTVNAFITINSINATAESCAGAGDGSITIDATVGGGQAGYSIDGGANYQFTNSFGSLSPGTYNIVVKAFGIPTECTATGTATVGAGNPATTWYKDADGDGYSDGNTLTSCTQPSGYIASPNAGTDCNDGNADIYPGAPELCDGLDNDCDGIVPANELDSDGDGYRVCDGDCNDTDAAVNPGATEICNGIDDDCDGEIDEGTSGGQTWTGNVTFVSQADVDAWMACYSIIDGNLTIAGYNITDLSNLINLMEVTGTLTIYYNSVLTTLDGLDNLATVGTGLSMFYNFLLSDCCAIYDLLDNGGVTGAISIFFNAAGCNSQSEILSECATTVTGGGSNNAIGWDLNGFQDVMLVPNPAKNTVTIGAEGLGEGAVVTIFDQLGRIAWTAQMEDGQNSVQVNLDLSNINCGIYFVSVSTENLRMVKRLVVAK